jgi:hypothetical protein
MHMISYRILQGKTNTYLSDYRFYPEAQAGDMGILGVAIEAVSCNTQGVEAPRYKPPRLNP